MGSRLQHTLDAFSEEIEEGPTDLQDVALVAALDSALAKPVKLRTTRGQRILCFIPLPLRRIILGDPKLLKILISAFLYLENTFDCAM